MCHECLYDIVSSLAISALAAPTPSYNVNPGSYPACERPVSRPAYDWENNASCIVPSPSAERSTSYPGPYNYNYSDGQPHQYPQQHKPGRPAYQPYPQSTQSTGYSDPASSKKDVPKYDFHAFRGKSYFASPPSQTATYQQPQSYQTPSATHAYQLSEASQTPSYQASDSEYPQPQPYREPPYHSQQYHPDASAYSVYTQPTTPYTPYQSSPYQAPTDRPNTYSQPKSTYSSGPADCRSAVEFFGSTGSPTLKKCIDIVCGAPGQTDEYRKRGIEQCDALKR
ncbi:hypothetical protein HDV00_002971 [Rhizophlyctis rosea]|nr:hypothetical protein HDV00_002971 [Rhizophlyctis rosea]